MKNRTKLLTTAFLSALIIAPLTACDQQGGKSEAEIQEIVKDYILDNPDLIVESLEQAQLKKVEEEKTKAMEAIKNNLAELENDDENTPFIGKADAKNVIVEFFDYNCGYCKRSLPLVLQAENEIEDVKIVLKELPILGQSSEQMSRAALVVFKQRPEKYFAFHQALMEIEEQVTPKVIERIAKEIGVGDIDFQKEVNNPEIGKIINANRQLSRKVGVRGTPAFIINGELIPGATSIERIKAIIADGKEAE